MAIEFRCANCGKLLRVGDDAAGRNAQCPECGGLTPVPAAPAGFPPRGPGAGGQDPVPPSSPFGTASGTPFGGPGFGDSGPGGGAQNPYQSPTQLGPEPMSITGDPLALSRVQGPAIALIVLGCIGVVLQLLGIAINVLQIGIMQAGGRHGPGAPFEMMFSGGMGIVMAIVGVIVSVVIIIGGMKMKNLESYALAMAGAIIAMIPCVSPCCLLGLPFGIWALVVLNDEAVRSAFRQ
jgi:hypothetical protein